MSEIREAKKQQMRIAVHAPLGYGGVTILMLSIQKNIDRSRLNFDYLVFHDRHEPQEDLVKSMGSQKLIASADHVPSKPLRGFVRFFVTWRMFRRNNVKVLHFNGGAPVGFVTMLAAKLGGVKWVTFHSHNGGMSNEGRMVKFVSKLCKPLLNLVVNDYWACSSLAAQFSFPKQIAQKKQYYFMPNGIDLDRFAYNSAVRAEVRAQMKWDNRFVVGHVGRFNHQKNHSFLIDIFAEVHKRDADAILALFGVGELQEKIREKVRRLGLENCVFFYGTSDCMDRMYQGMDIFLLPSNFEGLPVSGVEAQAAGLPSVLADTITRETAVDEHVVFLPLNLPPEAWAERVLEMKAAERYDCIEKLRNAGFDQKKMIEHFQQYYLDIGERLSLR